MVIRSKVRCVIGAFWGILLVTASRGSELPGSFRPPAVPLVTLDPYTSVWSFTDRLFESWPVHWTGTPQAMAGILRVDGNPYRFMGESAVCPRACEQVNLAVHPTRTVYTFRAGGVELELTFLTPMLPDDLSILTCPVTFLIHRVRSLDGRSHRVSLYFDASGEWVVHDAAQPIVWKRLPRPIAGHRWISMGSADQPILEKDGDNRRIDWGYFHVGSPDRPGWQGAVASHGVRQRFCLQGTLPERDDPDMPRPANRDWPVIACVAHMDQVSAETVERTLILAYDDLFSVEYMHRKLRPWWFRAHGGFEAMLASCLADLPGLRRRCEAFDRDLLDDARSIGGEAYARLVSISYRHTLASGKVVVSPDGSEPWFLHKECFSNGCMGTVDVSYPASPFFALFSPKLLEGMAAPILDYAASGKWPHPFAPHDIGRYPKGNGQVYNGTRLKGQMPVEECGNMILICAAAARASGDATFARRHWRLLTRWAEYLGEKGLDPENQLCTDDFTGHLAHNTNLSLKAINALGAYAMLSELLGEKETAAAYRRKARDMARRWPGMADDGDHHRLAFDRPGTWSMKYNLVWDRILDLGLFPPEVAQKEVAFYLKKQNEYGLPLDNRADFTKSDWLVWSATLADRREDFEKLIHPLYRFVNESPDRVPFSDWYFTSTAMVRGFRARPVIGGIFIPFLKDRQLWRKWAGRGGSAGSRGQGKTGSPGLEGAGETWPRFRGKGGGGIAPGEYPRSWNVTTGEGILWKIQPPLPGVSSPLVWGKRVFLTGASASSRRIYCIHADSGKLLWTGAVENVPGSPEKPIEVDKGTGHAASTPVTDGRGVYGIFANGDVAAFDLEGNRLWARNLGVPRNPYGYASSLEIHDGKILVQLDPASEEDDCAKMVALDGLTGKVLWEVKRPVEMAWATPLAIESGGSPRVVTSSDARILAHDLKDGRIIWEVECTGSEMIPSPIFAGGLVIAAISGDQVYAIRPGGSGNVSRSHVAWVQEDIVPDVPTPVASGDLVFLLDSSGYLGCCEVKTGKLIWEKDLGADFYSSPVIAGGVLYMVQRDGGVVMAGVSRKYEEIGRASIGEKCEATPAFLGGRIYIRGLKHLFCIGK